MSSVPQTLHALDMSGSASFFRNRDGTSDSPLERRSCAEAEPGVFEGAARARLGTPAA